MVVLRAIGAFFKKIWDWIKNTAWIQPLLIVGIIFGVIFSIPSIVKAVNASKKDKSKYNTYYHQFKLSLEGEANSEADKFTTELEEVFNDNEENFKKDYADLGNRFFVMYVAKECAECESAKEGFKKFEDNFAKYMTNTSNADSFGLVTIFTDDVNNETSDSKSAFVYYLERHTDFFEDAGSVAYETDYFRNNKINTDDIEALETADPDNFLTPTIFLVELKDAAPQGVHAGVTEVMFGVEGSDKSSKARTLADCWNHTGDFSVNKEVK